MSFPCSAPENDFRAIDQPIRIPLLALVSRPTKFTIVRSWLRHLSAIMISTTSIANIDVSNKIDSYRSGYVPHDNTRDIIEIEETAPVRRHSAAFIWYLLRYSRSLILFLHFQRNCFALGPLEKLSSFFITYDAMVSISLLWTRAYRTLPLSVYFSLCKANYHLNEWYLQASVKQSHAITLTLLLFLFTR